MIKIYNQLVPVELCESIVEKLKDMSGWYANSYNSKRITIQIDELPELEKIIKEHFSDYEFRIDKRCYFQVYEKGEYCANHTDPKGHTLIILIKKPDSGGLLSIGSNIAKLDTGDGVLFDGVTPHRVTTVFEGTRITFATWFK